MRPVLAATAVVLLQASTALAHPEVDEGARLLAEADFEGALDAFERAEAADALTRSDLVELFAGRAATLMALDRLPEAEVALSHLLAIEPSWTAPASSHPDLVAAVERTRATVEPLSIGLGIRVTTTGVEARAIQGGGAPGLATRAIVHGRIEGGAWRSAPDRLSLDSGGEVAEIWVELVGPGGARLASEASATQPRRVEPRPTERVAEGGSPWPWIGAAAGAVAVGVVLAVVLTRPDTVRTQPSTPLVRF